MSTVPVDVVKIDTSQSIKSVADLRKYIKQLKDQMVGLEEGSDEFLELANKIGEANHQMIAINEAVKGFSADFGDVLGNISTTAAGVVGGINAISSAVKIFGGESELAQEAMLKLQQSMAIVQGLSAIDAGIKSFKKLIPVIKLATAAMRSFAMSNPFTAIIAGATMLIGLIAGIASALDNSAEKAMKNAEAFAKAQEKQFKSLDKAKERLDYELRYAAALGKSTEELYKMEKAQKASNVETARSIMLKAQEAYQNETDAEAKKKLLEEYKKAKSVYEAELKDYQNLQNNKRIADAQAATDRRKQRAADAKAAAEERKRLGNEHRKEREDQKLDDLKWEEARDEETLKRHEIQLQQQSKTELEISEDLNKKRLKNVDKYLEKYNALAQEWQKKSAEATDKALSEEYTNRANEVIEYIGDLETEKMQLQLEKTQLTEERITATIEEAHNKRLNAQNEADLERAKQHLEITKGMAIEEATVMGELGKMFWNTEQRDEYLEKIKSIQDTIADLQSKGNVIDAEQEKLEELHKNNLISEEEYISQKYQLDMQQIENAQAIANAEIEIEREKNKQKAAEAKNLVKGYQEVSSAIEDVLGGIAANMDENSAEYKAIMIAQTIISMLSGSVKAWTAAMDLGMPIGPIVGAIQSAAIIANGVATINKMKQTTKDSTSTGSISSTASSAAMHPTQNVYINNDAVPMENVADTRVYVLESDITSTQRSSRVQVSEATF